MYSDDNIPNGKNGEGKHHSFYVSGPWRNYNTARVSYSDILHILRRADRNFGLCHNQARQDDLCHNKGSPADNPYIVSTLKKEEKYGRLGEETNTR